jgi:hypothetical protein
MFGKIFFFDKDKGEGEVIGDNGITYYFFYDAIIDLDRTQDGFWEGASSLNKDNKKILSRYMSGAKVEFSLYENAYMKQIDSIWLI